MSNNIPDYKNNLFFESDYSIYQTARKLRKLAKERNFKIKRENKTWLEFSNETISINIFTRTVVSLDNGDFIIQPKTNKHLIDIVEVLTRS